MLGGCRVSTLCLVNYTPRYLPTTVWGYGLRWVLCRSRCFAIWSQTTICSGCWCYESSLASRSWYNNTRIWQQYWLNIKYSICESHKVVLAVWVGKEGKTISVTLVVLSDERWLDLNQGTTAANTVLSRFRAGPIDLVVCSGNWKQMKIVWPLQHFRRSRISIVPTVMYQYLVEIQAWPMPTRENLQPVCYCTRSFNKYLLVVLWLRG